MFSHLADTSFGRHTRYGFLDTQVFMQPHLQDGKVLWMGMRWLHIGTRPLDLMEEVGREARLIVREGMKEILEWLGEPWYNEPTGQEILAALKRGSTSLLDDSKHHGVAA